jgi:sugar phosphate isomerase/epimerase
VNSDIGDLNALLDAGGRMERDKHLSRLLELAARVGATALVLPCGALSREPRRTLAEDLDLVVEELEAAANRAASFGLQLWTESLHFLRLCWNAERAAALHERLAPAVGVVMDFSHVTASGSEAVDFVDATADRIRHVHVRDARPGDIHLSVGRGVADFAGGLAALREYSYSGHVALELETRDIDDADRPAAALAAAEYISHLL